MRLPLEEPDSVAVLVPVRLGEALSVEEEEGVDVAERVLETVPVPLTVDEAEPVCVEVLVCEDEPVCV